MKFRARLTVIPIAAVAAVGVFALANPFSASAVGAAANPLSPLAGFTVVVQGDSSLGNQEIEGSVAVGGDLTLTKNYSFIHSSGLTPTNYDLPVIGGDPTRLLIGGQFDTTASVGVSELSSRGYVRANQLGYLKIGDTSNLALNPRGNQGLGVWASAVGTTAGTEPALYVTDTVAEPQSSVAATGAFASEFSGAFATLTATGASLRNLATCTAAHETVLTPGSDAGQRTIALVAGVTNYISLSAADLAFNEIVFVGAQPSSDTPVIFNITGSPDTITIPRFAAANSTSATSPNTIAPYVLWNLSGVTDPITIHGDKISGSILAPTSAVTLDASSPLEGQLAANTLTTAGGEIHHYAFNATVACLTGSTVTTTPTDTVTPTVTAPPAPPTTPTDTVTPTVTAPPANPATPTVTPTDGATTTTTGSTSSGSDGSVTVSTTEQPPTTEQLPTLALTESDVTALAFTGANATATVMTGAVLLGLGVLALLATMVRRRRSARGAEASVGNDSL
ncbi:collagen-binding domain-containing protein [Lacisediminihabitans sp.]|uniref:collagen-binding domain-containing protein n=1 Tax=Lacisediminihabitans sp. TaxID=2787631 RepID=UPI002F91DEBC